VVPTTVNVSTVEVVRLGMAARPYCAVNGLRRTGRSSKRFGVDINPYAPTT